jgi:hypothetical protein
MSLAKRRRDQDLFQQRKRYYLIPDKGKRRAARAVKHIKHNQHRRDRLAAKLELEWELSASTDEEYF